MTSRPSRSLTGRRASALSSAPGSSTSAPASLPSAVSPERGQSRYAALAAALRRRVVKASGPPAARCRPRRASPPSTAWRWARCGARLELLVEQGLIERHHGKGTFVRGGLTGAPMLRFFRFDAGVGEVPRSRIVARQPVRATAEVAHRLGVGRGDAVLRLQRLRSLGGRPRLLEEIWLPLPLFAGLQQIRRPSGATCSTPSSSSAAASPSRAPATRSPSPTSRRHRRVRSSCRPASRRAQSHARRGRHRPLRRVRVTRADAFAFRYGVTIT